MMRSLFSGVSGLRNHQVQMDIIGNNIANVNTVAFKSSRLLFQDMLSQTLKAAGGAGGGRGGTNPQQAGLGMRIGSIDTIFSQGNLMATQRKTDLAIQGDGFFILSDGTNRFYSRAGGFDFDLNGNMVNPANGYIVQGYMAVGDILSTILEDVQIEFSQSLPAAVTAQIDFAGNLDAGADSTSALSSSLLTKLFDVDGNVMNLQVGNDISMTGKVVTPAVEGTLLAALEDSSGTDLGIADGETIAYAGDIAAVGFSGSLVVTGATDTLETLRADLEGELQVIDATITVTITSAGELQITAGTGLIEDFTIKDDAAVDIFTFADIAAGTSVESNEFVGTSVDISGTEEVTADLSLSDMAAALQTAIRTASSGTETVTVQADGSISVTGSAKILNGIALSCTGKTEFNTYGIFDTSIAVGGSGETAEGIRTADYTTFVTAYDSLGDPQIITLLFAKDAITSNSWKWQALVPYESGVYPSGDNGDITFNADGSLAAGSAQITFDPDGTGGVEEMVVDFNFGTAQEFDGITQFSSSFSVTIKEQDGYASGTLDDIFIDDSGIVTGVFTNGVNKSLAQVGLANFANPGGLLKAGDSLYKPSLNSGVAQEGTAGSGGMGVIASSTLEMSNVDLAQSFTEMIIAQRGFQVNARVITTSDELLQELVNLRR